ncbi:ABC transporter permease [Jiangella alkaliphila]|nr:ABC transporter permease [Jiangella alkaliphila]
MTRYVAGRLAQIVLLAFLASLLIFMFSRALPGDPATLYAGPDASPETVAAVRASFGLDEPIFVQYWRWLTEALQGNFGQSYNSRLPVSELVAGALPATLQLAAASLVLALMIGLPTGVISALKPGSKADYAITTYNGLALSIPGFWLAILLIILFALVLGLLPAGGRVSIFDDPAGALRTIALPAVVLAFRLSAVLSRFTRTVVLEALNDDHVLTATAKGLSRRAVLTKHVLRNAVVPLITIIAVEVAELLNGAVILEALFGWPGMGWLSVQAVQTRDYLLLQAILLVFVLVTLVLNLLADVAQARLDPRVRTRRGALR